MGLIMSLAGKGLPITPGLGKVMDKFLDELVDKDIKELEDFHVEVLKMFVTVNKALPGKQWVVPPYQDIKKTFDDMQQASGGAEGKKKVVVDFMRECIKPNKLDNSLLVIGLATPPAAMAAKKAGEGVPQLKFMKSVPDVVFVPGATLLTLTAVRFFRLFFLQQKHLKSEDHLVERNHIGTSAS